MDLFEDDTPQGNAPEFSVSELSGAVKRMVEGEFSHVRVRGELGRISRPASGHIYLDLKDDKSVLAAVVWKGQASRLSARPEEGLEVIATGRLTTFPGQSKYQMIIEDIAPAGAGALMARLEKLKAQLGEEGLFDPARKKPIPFLPEVIGVVTSPSGAVIRDILHRLRDRFPRKVIVWPVAVQGQAAAGEVARAIAGFNTWTPGGAMPRPDLLIVARGGGSVEDLWAFNEEVVVRAAAASQIPLISAVGHETDTTLIDYAADRRAPTPTAAAEMAVPVRMDLLSQLQSLEARQARAITLAMTRRGQRLTDLSRALPRPDAIVAAQAQRLDFVSQRLDAALQNGVEARAAKLRGMALTPSVLRARINSDSRTIATLDTRATAAAARLLAQKQQAVENLDRLRETLGYEATLKRGFAVVRADGHVATSTKALEAAKTVEVELADGRVTLR
ncbi:exodeoxyribonuclease VII large subunit [Ketogulonicigenium robustum]|uniref:Exodeoxyribonuclease 7 large subunit n=1 Tax=Ketogulonicigenium robustum TaxID=92947 RepID=A0A1W6NXF5_9RHOB|nr:exodeoxyribonuclease VII large subunit [Ketogulonicigenium robustum]ARO13914.1 exodeoxyribonuclease VII large subunit [Ketogulonicigenium robustum]